MDDNLRAFLEKFAELERRVRKLAVEDRALRQELKTARERAVSAEAETGVLRELLLREKGLRLQARDQLDGLIARLDGAKGPLSDLRAGAKVKKGNNGGGAKAPAPSVKEKAAEAESEL